jgi:hypothetical protein
MGMSERRRMTLQRHADLIAGLVVHLDSRILQEAHNPTRLPARAGGKASQADDERGAGALEDFVKAYRKGRRRSSAAAMHCSDEAAALAFAPTAAA